MNSVFISDPPPRIAQIAKAAKSQVWLVSGSQEADASSVISILMLSCMKDSVVTIKIESQEDMPTMKNIAGLLGDDFAFSDPDAVFA